MKKLLFFLVIIFNLTFAEDPQKVVANGMIRERNSQNENNFRKVFDTLYTSSDYFVEIDLSKQLGYLHSRFQPVKTFKVSTGTIKIEDGVETKPGIFVIQHKAKKWYSTQFDSTLMLYWMGFNYGIGFHALAGNSYYKYLGKKTSSHGCIRISREDGEELFGILNYGTPVIINNGESAIKIGFADKNGLDYKYYNSDNLLREIKRRLKHLYSGNYFDFVSEKLIIDQNNVTHDGLTIGDYRRVPSRQNFYPESRFVEIALSQLKCEIIPTERLSFKESIAFSE